MSVFHSGINNFGDALNKAFWPKAAPGIFETGVGDTVWFGIGTLLNDRLLSQFPKKRILGSGVGYGSLTPGLHYREADVVCVRGPLSAEAMKIDRRYAITDPAILTPRLDIIPDALTATDGQVVFIPHHYTDGMSLNWDHVCRRAGVRHVSPAQDPVEVIQNIRNARLVIAEAMHAAILADAFRVPWVPVALTPVINEFKWRDFFLSMELDCGLNHVFAREQKVLEVLRRLRPRGTGKPAAAMGGAAPSAASTSAPKAKARGKTLFERMPRLSEGLISRKLAGLSRHSGILSDDRVLVDRQDALTAAFHSL